MALSDVRGHQARAVQIRAALTGDRPGHAYLFAGLGGVGKALFARQVAKFLFCESPDDSCDFCKSCRQVDHDNHPDLHVVEALDGKRFISIAQIQTLCGHYALRPHTDRRIAIVRDADRMTMEGANALLKTLEEPPSRGLLMLTTRRPDALPETVLSRCQTLRFGPLSREDVAEVLSQNSAWTPQAVRFAANVSDGSVGRAQEILEAGGLELRDRLVDRLRSLRSQDNFAMTAEILGRPQEAKRRLEEVRTELRLVLRLIVRYYRDVWSVQLGAPDARLFNADRAADVHADAERLTPFAVERAMELLMTSWGQVNRNLNLKLLLESLFFRLGALVRV